MKFGKKTIIFIVAGILIIAFASLGAIRSQQISEHEQISEELDLTQLEIKKFQLGQPSQRQEEMEAKLEQTITQFEDAETAFAQQLSSITISSILYDIAETSGTEVTEINSSGTTTDELGGITCTVLNLDARVEGDVLPLIDFITSLNDYLTTGFIRSVNIVIPESCSEEKPAANIQLLVYSYPG